MKLRNLKDLERGENAYIALLPSRYMKALNDVKKLAIYRIKQYKAEIKEIQKKNRERLKLEVQSADSYIVTLYSKIEELKDLFNITNDDLKGD